MPAESASSKNRGEVLEPKIPQRKRGVLRVAALLDAAAQVFLRKGFDAATMTEIAERADASIGSLYQFFPTKESIADTIRARYGDELCTRLKALRPHVAGYSAAQFAEKLIATDLEILDENPAFATLMVVRDRPGQNVIEVRRRMAQEVSDLLKLRLPHLSSPDAAAITSVVRHILRAVVDIAVEPRGREKAAAEAQMKVLLALYLQHHIDCAPQQRWRQR